MKLIKNLLYTNLLILTITAFFFIITTDLVVLAHSSEESKTTIIHMTDEGFEPDEVTIKQGEKVIFENESQYSAWPASNIHPTHSVYPNSHIDKCNSENISTIFDACKEIEAGDSFSFMFTIPGKWRYHDHLNPDFNGEITVTEDDTLVSEFLKSDKEEKTSPEVSDSLFQKIINFVRNILVSLGFIDDEQKVKTEPVDLSQVSILKIAHSNTALEKVLKSNGSEEVMQRLLEETGGGSEFDCHQEAHQVGRVSYMIYGAEVFELGDASCHSGYYHGAMESFLSENGTQNLAKNIQELCSTFPTSFGIFECLHGVGHGVLAYEDYDLLDGLESCEDLQDPFFIRSCYGGVYMENIITGQGVNGVIEHETKWLNKEDPHFPCNAVGDDYGRRFDCYQMQTSWMLTQTNFNFKKVADECLIAPDDMISVCYRSLGRDIAGHTLRDPERIFKLCAFAPKEENYYTQCLAGALNVIIDFWGPKLEHQADEFCEILTDEEMRQGCFLELSSRKTQLQPMR